MKGKYTPLFIGLFILAIAGGIIENTHADTVPSLNPWYYSATSTITTRATSTQVAIPELGANVPCIGTNGSSVLINNSGNCGSGGSSSGTVFLISGGHAISLSPATITASGTISVNTSTIIHDLILAGFSTSTPSASATGTDGSVQFSDGNGHFIFSPSYYYSSGTGDFMAPGFATPSGFGNFFIYGDPNGMDDPSEFFLLGGGGFQLSGGDSGGYAFHGGSISSFPGGTDPNDGSIILDAGDANSTQNGVIWISSLGSSTNDGQFYQGFDTSALTANRIAQFQDINGVLVEASSTDSPGLCYISTSTFPYYFLETCPGGSGGGGVATSSPASGFVYFVNSNTISGTSTVVQSLSNNSASGGIDFSNATGTAITAVLHSLAITQFTGNWVSTLNGATGTVAAVGTGNITSTQNGTTTSFSFTGILPTANGGTNTSTALGTAAFRPLTDFLASSTSVNNPSTTIPTNDNQLLNGAGFVAAGSSTVWTAQQKFGQGITVSGTVTFASSTGGVAFLSSTGTVIAITTSSLGLPTSLVATNTIIAGGTATGPAITIATSGPIQANCTGSTCTITAPATSTLGLSTSTGANPTASVGTSATNGSANTFMRSDAAPQINQAATFAFSALGNTTSTATISASRLQASTTASIGTSTPPTGALIVAGNSLFQGNQTSSIMVIGSSSLPFSPGCIGWVVSSTLTVWESYEVSSSIQLHLATSSSSGAPSCYFQFPN